ncbi:MULTISPECIES: flagellar basal-body rod protein FlgF [Comamonas]|jgi:flagellar basal-body rod protein FlgF|uniref:Flagellar basal-body rod protein FlgF n=1 Tax=Comamonas terrigena TaxID=32013 RepID=A0A2A7URX7_COMTR|nr:MULTISPECIES: flagellar basal-body rod protein FlgF [Comamonas]MBD9533860.1 flagellar basal-body rod protein FlgF [Comamonas sp. CMM01]MBV7419508.1 flagellar basal-body rod protein FlgF [Comamonas sp. CMM03]MDH0050786.1 flagellar basal-body rod protein FlgF [Comamonas terrigena]MDH0513188.1 flagellar basal-body rod protein FlgF [Comamonas terrigena]MDH1093121.1 flagellar basal-body rod protein FlgF [Comamonas terrigena]
MDRIIYTTMTGANAAAQRQAVLSNNLANASTTGFRSEMTTFRSVPVQGQGSTTRVFALDATSGHLETPGPAMTTGKNTDLMARGNAWFAVQGMDGMEAYTRNGALEVTEQGQLVTATGLPVLSDGGTPIDIPQNAKLNFGADGTVVATLPNQPPMSIGRLKMVTPTADQAIKRSDDGLFRGVNGDLPNDGNARLVAGTLEGSNVNAVEQMVGMIAASRQFEQQIKMLQTAESNDKTASQLLSMNG